MSRKIIDTKFKDFSMKNSQEWNTFFNPILSKTIAN